MLKKKAPDDGKRGGQLLPPLHHGRNRRAGQAGVSSSTEESPSGSVSPRRISVAMDKKIVSHLRRKLNKRLEKRLTQMIDAENLQNGENNNGDEWNGYRKDGSSPDIYHKYSDTGERLVGRRKGSQTQNPLLKKNSITHPNLHPRLSGHSVESLRTQKSVESDRSSSVSSANLDVSDTKPNGHPNLNMGVNRDDLNMKKPLPGISGGNIKTAESVDFGGRESSSGDKLSEDGKGEKDKKSLGVDGSEPVEREESLFGLTSVRVAEKGNMEIVEESQDEYLNFNDLDVSPVPTPKVSRPETRDTSRMSMEDKVNKILSGNMNLKMQPHTKDAKVFISSTFTDMEIDKTYLAEKLYASLKLHYLERGYDLEIVDPHWAMKDLTTDDHSEVDFCLNLIEECRETSAPISFVSFLSQKYGDPLLPSTISTDEFEQILAAIVEDEQRQLAILMELAAKQEEEEKKRQEEREAILEESRAHREKSNANEATNQDKLSESSAELRALTKKEEEPQSDDSVRTEDEGSSQDEKDRELERSDTKIQELMEGFRRRASEVGKEAITIKTLKGEYGSRDDIPDPGFLQTWYQLDANCVPPVYRLNNISTQYRDILHPDANKKVQAKNQWLMTAKRLQKQLYTYAQKVFDPEIAKKYCTSLVDLELEHGIFSLHTGVNRCYWFDRDIERLARHAADQKARDYMDISSANNTPDPELRTKLAVLRDTRVPQALPGDNKWSYQINWHPNGVSPSTTRAHQTYLDRLTKQFYNVMTSRLEDAIKKKISANELQSPLFREVLQHVHFCHNRSKMFHGRKDLLLTIKRYAKSTCNVPLVLYGKSGSGKTALLAKAAKESFKWQKSKCSVVVRFVGLTASSTNIRTLLKSLSLQLCHIHGDTDLGQLPEDYKGLLNDFNFRISRATESKPLLIFIGCLDRLSDENDARKLNWLPRELPANVKIIVSTLPDDQYECFKHLKRMINSAHPECFVEVPELPTTDAVVILNHWFSSNNRTVSQEQFDRIMENFEKCPYPLYLKVVFEEALRWPSSLDTTEIKLAETVKSAALFLFTRLERNHGEPLVRRALGYITAAKNGITTNELLDVLSLDETCMDHITVHYRPPMRRVPPVCWLRIKHDLRIFLEETEADKTMTMRWCHTPYSEAATERYLNQKDRAPSYHRALAEYFMDLWSKTPKPFGVGSSAKLRYVTPQPLFTEITDETGNKERIYNYRKLSELPYHFLKSQQIADLKKHCLCNFEFLLAKISATSLRTIFEDIQMALVCEPTDQDIRFISDTLHLSSKALRRDCRQLASQIVGRLHKIVAGDVPIAPGDPVKYPFLKPLFADAKKSSTTALVPSKTCLTAPGGILFDIMSGHTESITAVVTTSDGQRAVTTSRDNCLKLWQLRTGRVTKTITGVGANVLSLRLGLGNAAAITSETDCIQVHSLNTGKLVARIDQFADPACITTALDGSLMVAFFDGANMMRVWNLESEGTPLVKELRIAGAPGAEQPIHKDNSIVVAPTSHGAQILHAFRSSSNAVVRNVKSGKVIHDLTRNLGSVTALAISREYHIVAIRLNYMELHEIFQLELFDVRNGQYVRTVRGCVNCNVKEIYVNQLGSHCFSVCSSEANNTSDIAVWNIETEDHKHLARHAGVSHTGACVDMRYCLTASKQENMLRIWNLTSKINQQMPKEKVREGLELIVPMVDHPRYVVAKSTHNGPVAVWNVMKDGCAGNAVRIERGLVESNDIALIRNTKLVVLTNRGFSNVSEDGRPVFQTILVYDLKLKKCTTKLDGCYIVPSPVHEYVLLDDHHLLGLSDNRNHFVVWSLETGHATFRIKPSPKKLEVTVVDTIEAAKKRTSFRQIQPWELRESPSARERRQKAAVEEEKQKLENLKKEKDNAIEQFIISKDLKTIVASYYAHHINVFDVPSQSHIQTLENTNSMMFLHVAGLAANGSHLVHANYDDDTKTSYVTLWECKAGTVKRRLKNEKNVCAIAIGENAETIVFGKANKELRIWVPGRTNSLKKIKGYPGLNFGVGSQIHIMDGGEQAIVYAGEISIWDLEQGVVLAVFTPDMKINCFTTALGGKLILFGLRDTLEVVSLRLMSSESSGFEKIGSNMFGEKDDTSDEEDEDEGDV